MSTKTIGILLIVAGVLVMLVIFISPALGIGSHNIFTLKKMAVAAIGLVAAVAGVFLSLQKKPAA